MVFKCMLLKCDITYPSNYVANLIVISPTIAPKYIREVHLDSIIRKQIKINIFFRKKSVCYKTRL